MLTALRVKNLALVEDIRVSFESGLNVITGETGAGKSILMGALGLLLGERADKSLIRTGADQCSAEAVFSIEDTSFIAPLLDELGLDPLEEGQLIIRRVIKAQSGAQALVNDQPVTLQALRRIGDQLVDMHGPYDHQSLLSNDVQREILDAFGDLSAARKPYETSYQALRHVNERIDEVESVGGNVAEQIELLSFKVKELEEADLSEGEEEEVTQEHAVFGNAQRIMELANRVALTLTEDDLSVTDGLASVLRALEELQKLLPEAADWRADLEEASARIREVSAAVALRVDNIDADPARLEWLDQRLTIYQRMKRKYGPTISDALAQLDQARTRLEDLQSRDERLEALRKERAVILKELEQHGATLRQARQKTGVKLAKAITSELSALGFAHGRFGVEIIPSEPGPAGMDTVEFMFEPNVGEGMRPLRNIASSGEISRVMLATKAVLARHDRIPILVFDEIDANIGGETGGAVGRKLATVSEHHQILCITHLPQVAMYGAHHFAVRKQVEGKRTRTDVVMLEEEARVEEIARMLGGRSMTRSTLTHAREMLERVQR